MLAFLLILGLGCALIYAGVRISYRLYSSGAIERRKARRARKFHPLPAGPTIDEDTDYVAFQEAADDVTTRYARNGIIIMVLSVLAIAAILISILNTFIH
jgi:hypothetical protein